MPEAGLLQPTNPDRVTPFELGGARFYPLSSPSRGGCELAVWQLRLDAGLAGASHTIDREEVFVCLSGELLLTVDDRLVRLLSGDAVAVPGGSRLSAGAGDTEAIVLVCTRAGLSAVMDDGTLIRPAWAS